MHCKEIELQVLTIQLGQIVNQKSAKIKKMYNYFYNMYIYFLFLFYYYFVAERIRMQSRGCISLPDMNFHMLWQTR